jgi:diguanylate cyclase (GGDEF)-like protein/PAS domain S-box-containing protein
MLPALVDPARNGPPRPLPVLAPGLGAIALVGASMDVLPTLAAVTLGVGAVAAVYGVLLVRLALRIHASRRSFGPCRGAGFLGVGVLTNGATVVAIWIPGGRPSAPSAPSATVAAVGMLAGVTAYLLGLLFLPGAATTPGARLRRALDGLGVGACLLFSARLLADPQRVPDGLPHASVLVAGIALAIATVTGLRAVHYRRAALACAAGAILSIAGLAGLPILLAGQSRFGWWAAAGSALIAGPVLIWTGARRAGTGPSEPGAADVDGTLAGYPLLVLPVSAAIVTAVYHFRAGGTFDRTSEYLGIAGIVAIAMREAFAALDVRRYARRLADREAHFRSLAADSVDVALVLDADLVVRWQSPAAARLFGLSDLDVVGRALPAMIHPEDANRVVERLAAALGEGRPLVVAARLRDGFGCWRDTELTVCDERANPAVRAVVVHVRDVGERTELRRAVHQLQFTDQLTGLANREKLQSRVAELTAGPGAARAAGAAGAVLVINLDGLAAVNGLRGPDVGDAVLVEVGKRLRSSVGDSDLPARIGGDEFAVLTARVGVYAYALATRLSTVLTEPYDVPGWTLRLSACIGFAELSGPDGSGADDALRRAGIALRRARQLGRNRVECYDESMETALVRRTSLEQELPGAVGRGELDLVYQPVLELLHGLPVGVEALLRWRHPTLGTVPPTELVAVADELGLIDEIGDWVLHRACRQLSGWLRDGRHLWLAVNVSCRQLAAPGFVAAVRDAAETHAVPAERLVVEVAEAPGLQGIGGPDPSPLAAQLVGVRELGARVALDHFGAGSTSLAQLRRLPIDILKIDRSLFAEPAGQTGPAAPIIDVVVGLGNRLGLDIVAQGLEAEAHREVVRAAGCRYGQGFLLARPAPAEHVEAFLDSRVQGHR